MQVRDLLNWAVQELKKNPDPADRDDLLDARLLLCRAINKTQSWLMTWPDKDVEAQHSDHFKQLIERRQQGEPIAYILGHQPFWTLDLKVTPDTLIPRADTEILVETTLALDESNTPLSALDLGTGSGAIALSLASERPHWKITATDLSVAALSVAKENAEKHALQNLRFVQSHWFDMLSGSYDIIVSNPPYIEDQDHHLSQGDLRFEPRSALSSGPNGLDDIRKIVDQARDFLVPKGWLLFEHGYQQASVCRALLDQAGYQNIRSHRDFGGNERITCGQFES